MPTRQFYASGANGTVSIVNYANATNARVSPLSYLDDVFFHTSLPYVQLKGTIGPSTLGFSALNRAYYTWADGGGKGGGCFITQACVEAMGLEDDHYILKTLRYFRDKYMLSDIERCMKVADYYLAAPQIVQNINQRKDAHEIYERMLTDFVLPAVKAVEVKDYERAMEIYTNGVRYSAEAAGVDLGQR
jgi:hypothetical protein